MTVTRTETFDVQTATDVVRVRQVAREWAIQLGFSLVDQTKLVTAASELARNMLDYANGGMVTIEALDENSRPGLRLIFEDRGAGIPDIAMALRDGFTTGGGLGLGLGGAKRLVNEFDIESTVGVGTKVTVARWKP
jgi:serine/threonine-protein kinase RsbT